MTSSKGLHDPGLIFVLPVKEMLKAVGALYHTKYCEYSICPLFYSTFSSGGFTYLFFEAKRKTFSQFPWQRDDAVKTECWTLKNYQSHKLGFHSSCCIAIICPLSIPVGLPTSCFLFVGRLKEKQQSWTCKRWSSAVALKSTHIQKEKHF